MEIAKRDPSKNIYKMETPHVTDVAAVVTPARKWLRVGLGGDWKNESVGFWLEIQNTPVLFRPQLAGSGPSINKNMQTFLSRTPCQPVLDSWICLCPSPNH